MLKGEGNKNTTVVFLFVLKFLHNFLRGCDAQHEDKLVRVLLDTYFNAFFKDLFVLKVKLI